MLQNILRQWTSLPPHKIAIGCLRPHEPWRNIGESRIAARNPSNLIIRFSTRLPDADSLSFTRAKFARSSLANQFHSVPHGGIALKFDLVYSASFDSICSFRKRQLQECLGRRPHDFQ